MVIRVGQPQNYNIYVIYFQRIFRPQDKYTLLKVCGIVKITSDTLAEDEPLLAFARTVLLHNKNGMEYKIKNEMLYWDEAQTEYADSAFKLASVSVTLSYIFIK